MVSDHHEQSEETLFKLKEVESHGIKIGLEKSKSHLLTTTRMARI